MSIMNEASTIKGDGALRFNITGGEPFLAFDVLVRIIAHGASLGATVSCMTNAYWARSEDIATSKLTILRRAGLGDLGISVSRFHEQFIPLDRVRRALRVAKSLGLFTKLKGAVTRLDMKPGGALSQWKKELDADAIEIFPVLPYVREGASILDSEYFREPGLPEQRCPNANLCIEPNGLTFSCCGPSATSHFLAIGDVHTESLQTIKHRFDFSGKQTILRERGPIAFARRAVESGIGHRLRDSYAGPCDLCAHIGSDPELRAVADEMSLPVNQHTESKDVEAAI